MLGAMQKSRKGSSPEEPPKPGSKGLKKRCHWRVNFLSASLPAARGWLSGAVFAGSREDPFAHDARDVAFRELALGEVVIPGARRPNRKGFDEQPATQIGVGKRPLGGHQSGSHGGEFERDVGGVRR